MPTKQLVTPELSLHAYVMTAHRSGIHTEKHKLEMTQRDIKIEAARHTYRGNKHTDIHAVKMNTGWDAGLCLRHCLERLEEAFLNFLSKFPDDSLRIFDSMVFSSGHHIRTFFGHISKKSKIYTSQS